jgi:hypothetical protein
MLWQVSMVTLSSFDLVHSEALAVADGLMLCSPSPLKFRQLLVVLA